MVMHSTFCRMNARNTRPIESAVIVNLMLKKVLNICMRVVVLQSIQPTFIVVAIFTHFHNTSGLHTAKYANRTRTTFIKNNSKDNKIDIQGYSIHFFFFNQYTFLNDTLDSI